MMDSNRILQGITRGVQIAITRKVERKSFMPVTAVELQSKAWMMVNNSLRKAMNNKEPSAPTHP